mmetsp:Transcript_28759/g.72894  ORF Transcript_28759/g.72894 Transcript_28759/m.72894 type:complete len:207 (-) Transcript_28759:1260-1880(-)
MTATTGPSTCSASSLCATCRPSFGTLCHGTMPSVARRGCKRGWLASSRWTARRTGMTTSSFSCTSRRRCTCCLGCTATRARATATGTSLCSTARAFSSSFSFTRDLQSSSTTGYTVPSTGIRSTPSTTRTTTRRLSRSPFRGQRTLSWSTSCTPQISPYPSSVHGQLAAPASRCFTRTCLVSISSTSSDTATSSSFRCGSSRPCLS